MATPDPLAAVSPDVAARTKAILQAVATGGTAGLKAYEASQADLTQGKTDAVARAQQRANIIGGPEAQGFEGKAVQSYDKGIANLSTARAGFSANMAALGGAHKNYLDQVSAAVPLVRADTERQLALQREQAQAKDADKFLASDALGAAELTQANAKGELGTATAERDKAKTDFDGKTAGFDHTIKNANETDGAIVKMMEENGRQLNFLMNPRQTDYSAAETKKMIGEVTARQTQLSTALDQSRVARTKAQLDKDALAKTGSISADVEKRISGLQAMADRPLHEIARDIAVRGGVDKTRAAGLIGPEATLAHAKVANDTMAAGASTDVKNVAKWADTDLPTAQGLMGLEDYGSGRTVGYNGLGAEVDDKGQIDGQTPWEMFLGGIADLLTGDPADALAYKALVGEFQPLYTAAGRTKAKK